MSGMLYRTIMRIAHKYNWHYAPPIYPDGDTHLWCKWCGFRQTIKEGKKSINNEEPRVNCINPNEELKSEMKERGEG